MARTSDIGCCLEDMKAGVCGTWDVGRWTLSFRSEGIGLHHVGRGTLLQRCGPQGGPWTWDVGRCFRDVGHRAGFGLGTLDVVSTSGPGGPPRPFQKNPTITSVLNRSAVTPKEADAAAASAAATAAAAVARNQDPTSRSPRPDGARGASGTQERVNLAVQTSLAGRQIRPCRTATP